VHECQARTGTDNVPAKWTFVGFSPGGGPKAGPGKRVSEGGSEFPSTRAHIGKRELTIKGKRGINE